MILQWNADHIFDQDPSALQSACEGMPGGTSVKQTRILKWVAFPFSRGSSQPRGQTQVSHIAGKFFAREAHAKNMRLYF